MQRTGVLLRGDEMTIRLIGVVLLPPRKVNAHEFIGQGAAGLVVLPLFRSFCWS